MESRLSGQCGFLFFNGPTVTVTPVAGRTTVRPGRNLNRRVILL